MVRALSCVLSILLLVLGGSCADAQPRRASADRAARSRGAIQGGTAETGNSAVVGILFEDAQGYFSICSGTLIAPNLVLTAQHCVADAPSVDCVSSNKFGSAYPASSFYVTPSATATDPAYNGGWGATVDNNTWFAVTKIWTPGSVFCGNDMALLELAAPITSVCPLMPRVDAVVTQGESYSAVGIGYTSAFDDSNGGIRRRLSGLSVSCTGLCPDSEASEWEGGTNNQQKGVCEGDSGGPALDAQGRIIGVVSRGLVNACNWTTYQSVVSKAAWIKQQAQVAANDGNYNVAPWVTGASTSMQSSSYCPNATGGGAGGGSSTTGGGTGGGSTGGGTGAGGGTGSSLGCPGLLVCEDLSGSQEYACVDTSTVDGNPPNAPACQRQSDCSTGYSCWEFSSTESWCLKDCAPGGSTGGGTGSTGGGTAATGGGTAATGGGTAATGGGTAATGGGTAATGGGTAATGGGTAATGGGTAATGGGTAATGGGTAATGGGEGSTGGGNGDGGGAGSTGGGATGGGAGGGGDVQQPMPTCGCSSGAELSMAALAFGVVLSSRRRRR